MVLWFKRVKIIKTNRFGGCDTMEAKRNQKLKLSQLPSPALAGVVKEKSVGDAAAEIKNCFFDGATMIDLHLSCLDVSDIESLRKIISSSPLPVLALNYNVTCSQQEAGFSEEERVESFLRAVKAGAAGVDIQGYTYHLPSKQGYCGKDPDQYVFTKGKPREVVTDEKIIARQCELIDRVHAMGAEVLLSCHPGIMMRCEEVVELALFFEKRSPDIIKIVTRAETQDDLAESIRTMTVLKKEVKTPVAYHSCGEAGLLSRIVNPLLGGHIAFCVDRYNGASAIEQLDLRAARTVVDQVEKMI